MQQKTIYTLSAILILIFSYTTVGFAKEMFNGGSYHRSVSMAAQSLQDQEKIYYDKIFKTKTLNELEELWETIVVDNMQYREETSHLRAAYNAQKAVLLCMSGSASEAYDLLENAPVVLLDPFAFAYQMVAMMSTNSNWDLSRKSLENRKLLYMEELVRLNHCPEDQEIETYIQKITNEIGKMDIALAAAYEQIGEDKKALFYVKQTISKNKKVVQINALYTRLLERSGDTILLRTELEDFVKQGAFNAEMKKQLEQLYEAESSAISFDVYFSDLERVYLSQIRNAIKEKLIDVKAPELKLTDLQGKTVSLEDFKGKIVVLDFWATWCGPCIASFPTMTKARDLFIQENKNVVFLFINTGERESIEKDRISKLEEFLTDKPYTLDVLIDTDNAVAKQYDIKSIPAKFIIDDKGNIRYQASGFNSNEREAIEEMRIIVDLIS